MANLSKCPTTPQYWPMSRIRSAALSVRTQLRAIGLCLSNEHLFYHAAPLNLPLEEVADAVESIENIAKYETD